MKAISHKIWFIMGVIALGACSDTLYTPDDTRTPDDEDGMAFSVRTTEQADLIVSLGTTRADGAIVPDSATLRANANTVRPLRGDAVDGHPLYLHRVPLPAMGATTAIAPATRADASEMVTSSGSYFHDSLTIWGYTKKPYPKVNGETGTTIFDEVLLKRIRNWRSSAHWPYGGGHMRFYAVAPALESMEDLGVTNSSENPISYTQSPVISFTIPDSTATQRDLLYGESDEVDIEAFGTKESHLGKDDKQVDLHFRHLLTAIRFAQGTIPTNVTVKSITISGVHNSGTYDTSAASPSWSLVDTHTASYTLNHLSSHTQGTNTFIDGQQVLFLMPQTLPDGATLTVTLEEIQKPNTDNKGNLTSGYTDISATPVTHTLTCDLKSDVWAEGYTVIYTLTIGRTAEDYYLFADPTTAHEHNSTSSTDGSFTLHSFRNYIDYSSGTPTVNQDKAVGWEVVGYNYVDAEAETTPTDFSTTTKPGWLSTFPSSGNGGYATNVAYEIAKQETEFASNSPKHSTVLQGNGEASSEDLGKTGTANCYIVNKYGTYYFPLVYGNCNVDSNIFVDHRGTPINSGFIKDQVGGKNVDEINKIKDNLPTEGLSTTVTYYKWTGSTGDNDMRAELTWQDAPGLITSLQVNSNDGLNSNGRIGFTILKDNIQPGNAVISLKAHQITETWTREAKGTDPETYTDWAKTSTVVGPEETLWSWHIWVTDEVYSNAATLGDTENSSTNKLYLNYNGDNADHLVTLGSNKILPVNLGWVPDADDFGFYKHRKVWVKLQQTEAKEGEDKATCVVVIEQHARQPLVTGTSTVYQWGRPTALPAVLKVDNTKRAIYDGSGNDITDQFTLQTVANAGDAITQTKSMLRYNNSSDGSTRWFDLVGGKSPQYWSSSTKTIYDPCPPGFQLPPTTALTGFSRNPKDADSNYNGTGLNMWPDADGQKSGSRDAGGYLYTTPYDAATFDSNRYGPMVYMPVTAEWQGDLEAGTKMDETAEGKRLHINSTFGIYWCGDENTSQKKDAPALWLCPDWTYINDGAKPAYRIGIFTSNRMYFSSAQPIRPMQTP